MTHSRGGAQAVVFSLPKNEPGQPNLPLEDGCVEQPVEIVQLIREHHADVYRYAFRLTGTQTDAEDLVQQTFLIAQQKLHQVRDPGRARSWLFSVLRNSYLKQKRRAPLLSLEAEDERIADENARSAGAAEWIDREWLQSALDRLSDEHKVILLMFYFEDLSYKDIAERLGIPAGTVMSRLARAKDRLRALLAPEEGVAPEATFPKSGMAV
jgi:RNA polymerase sigma-70 factor, ECF subfamily